jgi:glycosyltransferase involved in cell wall biosynthesis
MSGLHFAFLTTFYPPYNFGGDGIGIQRLARGLVHAGHRVTVIHDADAYIALANRLPPPAEPEPDGLAVIPLRSGLGILSPLLTQQTGRPIVNGRRIRRMLAERQVDVITYHNVSLIGGPGLFAVGTGVKLFMAHEHWLVCPTHVLWRHGRELCTGKQCFRCQLHYHRPPQWWRWTGLLRRRLQHIDRFIAMSEFSRDKHHEFGFPREMDVLPYFLPEQRQEAVPTDDGSPHARPYFLFVGRLERIKGLQDVIPSFAGEGPTDLVVAGDGEFGPELRAQAADHPRVRFLGRISGAELGRWYRHAVALVVPSRCYETFGIILLEAFRQSTPVIARRLGPLPELIRASGGGELFGDRAELEAAMARLLQDRAYRDRLAAAGHHALEAMWTERTVVPRFLDIVRAAAADRGDERVLSTLS